MCDSGGMLTAKRLLAWRFSQPSVWVGTSRERGGGVGTLNGQDKLKSQPAILLFRPVDAIKQEYELGGLYVTTRLILRDFPAALNISLFGTTYHVLTKHGICKCPNKYFLALYLIPCPGPAASEVCHTVTVENPQG